MDKSLLGRLIIALGGLVLSLQIYGLKFIQGIEMRSGSGYSNATNYATEEPMLQALFITIAIIIYGFVLVIKSDKVKK